MSDDERVRPADDEVDAAAEREADPDDEQPRRRRLSTWQELLVLLVVAVVLAIGLKAFLLQAFYIPSESMEPGLVRGDRILVEKPSYWGDGGPERGDVIVFEDPGNWLGEGIETGPENAATRVLATLGLYPEGGHLVKRVIGVAGDTIVCCDDQGRISVNGQPLDEDEYVDAAGIRCHGPMTADCDWTAGPVPEGKVFVMGDNREHSADSTVHLCTDDVTDCTDDPYVSTDLVVGKVFALLWPRSRFELLDRPEVFASVPEPGDPEE